MKHWWFLRRRRRRRRAAKVRLGRDPWRQLRVGLAALGAVLVVSTIGYTILGLDPFDALYQTASTVTTVGFGEIGVDQAGERSYRYFTLFVVLIGASTAVYTLSVLLETLVEGHLNQDLRRKRMARQIDSYQDHVIVVGWGRVGRAIARYARRHDADVVVVDAQPLDTDDLPIVVGDAHDDDTLVSAGIERASVLIAALDTDSANLALTLTARSLRPDLFLVARSAKQSNEKKFIQAGADRVVNPHDIGGSRMAALAMQPAVAEFMDDVLSDDEHDVDLTQIEVAADSPALDHTLAELATAEGRALIVAIREPAGSYVANPPSNHQLQAGDILVALGSAAEVSALRKAVSHRRTTLHRRG
jgi:voltage-gated potassium channel